MEQKLSKSGVERVFCIFGAATARRHGPGEISKFLRACDEAMPRLTGLRCIVNGRSRCSARARAQPNFTEILRTRNLMQR